MAYNVLKGVVEGSVDQHGDQEIGGVKVFKSTISASVFYDTDAQSPCATLKDVAFTKVLGGASNSILTFEENGIARSHHNLTFNGEVLSTPHVKAAKFTGNASGLTSIPTSKLDSKITGDQIQNGNGLTSIRGNLQVKNAPGISVGEDGVGISLCSQGGLTLSNKGIAICPSKSEPVTSHGQNLSDNDVLIVEDVSRSALTHTTLSNLYDSYIKNKISHAHGNMHNIQLRGKTGFTSSSKFSYDTNSDILKIDGRVKASALEVEGDIRCNGAIIQNIVQITDRVYETTPADYTILCDTQKNPIDVILPPACNNIGRVLVIKKASSDKYKLNSHPVKLKVHEGTIDLTNEITIKTNYAACSVQSDGNKWWVINSKGS